MKKLIIFIFALPFLFLASCDKVKKPNQRPPVVYHCIDTLHQVKNSNDKDQDLRKVLVEDYTGHYCPNCPRAAEAAEGILKSNPNRVVVIANHVTTVYAKTNPDTTSSLYRENFMNEVSTNWDSKQYFSISTSGGLPNGTVNRLGNPNFTKAYSQWASLVSAALSQTQSARLDVKSYYDTLNHFLTATVKTTFKAARTNDVNMVLLLTQDSITACQKDNDPNVASNDRDPKEPQTRLHYKFDHVVIDVINGELGQLVKATPNLNDTVSITNTCYVLSKCFGRSYIGTNYTVKCVNHKYVNLVAFVYDVKTFEVLQVEKIRIIK